MSESAPIDIQRASSCVMSGRLILGSKATSCRVLFGEAAAVSSCTVSVIHHGASVFRFDLSFQSLELPHDIRRRGIMCIHHGHTAI